MYSDYNFIPLKEKQNIKKEEKKMIFTASTKLPMRSIYKKKRVVYTRNIIIGGKDVK